MAERGRAPGRTRGIAGTWPPPRAAAGAGGFAPSDFTAWISFVEKLREWICAKSGPGRLLPWVPIAYGTGIAIYFAADREPVLPAAVGLALVLCVAAFLFRRQKVFAVAVLLAAVAAGFAVATCRTARVDHVVLTRPAFSVTLSGFVETRDIRERTDRFVLRVTQMESVRPVPRLTRVRLSVRKGAAPDVGSFVTLKARLQPPLAPMQPGSYDFGRDMFFQRIAASGFVTGTIKAVEPPGGGGLSLRYAAFMQGLRDAIDGPIRGSGRRQARHRHRAVDRPPRCHHRARERRHVYFGAWPRVVDIGLSHGRGGRRGLLCGAGAVGADPASRRGLSNQEMGGATALAAAAFYLLLSGNEVATQRSFFMTAVVLIGVMVDRRAVTFRTLAVAAMIVLTLVPEALVHPSFQMSFAATLGLVALVQIGLPGLLASPDHSRAAKIALWGGREILTLMLASLVAGLATTPYAAFHFHRVTPYGVLANLAAMPVVSALVMPAGMLGLRPCPSASMASSGG